MKLLNTDAIILTLFILSSTARAEQAVDPKAFAKAQFMLRQVTSERDSAQAESNRLKTELDSIKARKSSVDGALSKSRESLRELQENHERTQTEKAVAEQALADHTRRLEACTVKNTKLHELNSELLQRYAKKGVVDAVVLREPFTGIKKVELENLLQDLQDKIDAQRVSAADAQDRGETQRETSKDAASVLRGKSKTEEGKPESGVGVNR